MSSKNLRATNAFKSNDSAEIKIGFSLLCENLLKGINAKLIHQFIAEVYTENKKYKKDRRELSIFNKAGISEEQKSIANMLDVLWGFIDPECPDTFIRFIGISCFFSVEYINEIDKARDKDFFENNGVLPQWRHYGEYALKFNEKIIRDYMDEYNKKFDGKISLEQPEGIFFAGKVQYFYEHEAEEFWANKDLEETIKLFRTKTFCTTVKKLFKREKLSAEENDFIGKIFLNFAICCFMAKHRSYKDEHEFRILNVVQDERAKDVRDISNGYVELFRGKEVIEKALTEIIITPIHERLDSASEEKKKEIEKKLRDNGFKDVKVKLSEIPVSNNKLS